MALEVTHSSLFNGLWAPVTLKADFTKFHFCGFFTYFTYVEYSHISLCCPKWFPYGPIYTLLYSAAFPPELMFGVGMLVIVLWKLCLHFANLCHSSSHIPVELPHQTPVISAFQTKHNLVQWPQLFSLACMVFHTQE